MKRKRIGLDSEEVAQRVWDAVQSCMAMSDELTSHDLQLLLQALIRAASAIMVMHSGGNIDHLNEYLKCFSHNLGSCVEVMVNGTDKVEGVLH